MTRTQTDWRGLDSWFALNPQLRWAIDDILSARLRREGQPVDRGTLADIKTAMADGRPGIWQRWWALGDRARASRVSAALRRAGLARRRS